MSARPHDESKHCHGCLDEIRSHAWKVNMRLGMILVLLGFCAARLLYV